MNQASREFVFTSADFERVRKIIYEMAGIALGDCKHDLVYGRLARRLRAKGIRSFREYLDHVEADHGEEREIFINSLTTNLTSFFREPHHFPVLARHAQRERNGAPFRIWCSACSTGEEAYSIAMTLAEALGERNRAVEIVASDLDTQVLDTARRGVYALDRIRTIETARLKRFFRRGAGRNEGLARIRHDALHPIRFERINLLAPSWPLEGLFDVIFCRNVMIYFDKPTQRTLLQRFHPLLKPDGLLICGHSESLMHCADLFRNLGRTVYAPIHRTQGPAGRSAGALR
ncbi:MAG: chemotaxis protein CheR [Rhodocyclaceae bacterium]|jgi:chemotaxis protein methyltransferase CheR|nr:chemotaxis protein CheR [Rhodocyclaceae bacterium]